MRISDPGVDTDIAALAVDGDGLDTAIVAFFANDQASPSQNPPDLARRTRARVSSRRDMALPALRR